MADVEVAVGLGRKARLHDGIAVLLRAHIFGDDVAEEVWKSGCGRAFQIGVRHCCGSLCANRLCSTERFKAGFGFSDAGEADVAAKHDHGFKERGRVFASAYGDADGLKHRTGL